MNKPLSKGRKNGEGSVAQEERDGLRRCLVSGAFKPKEDLVRFVAGPDGKIVPDLSEKLPGHGFWLTADKATIDEAVKKKIFLKASKGAARATPDLADQTAALSLKRFCDLLGLARGAGLVLTGFVQVEECVKTGKAAYVMIAQDAGSDAATKFARNPILTLSAPPRDILSQALGRENAVYLAMKSNNLAEKVKNELERWHKLAPSSTFPFQNPISDEP